jgi:ParB/RepB/Spo0J family partition protein
MTDTVVQHTLDVRWFSINEVEVDPDNVRHDLGDLTELAADIRANGILQPPSVYRFGDVYRVLFGNRRVTAAELAGLRSIPCQVVDPPTEAERIELQLAENLQRSELNPIDEGNAIASLRALGQHRTIAQLAKRLHRSPEWVSQRLRLVEQLPDQVQDLVVAGDLPIGEAASIAALKAGDDEKAALASKDARERPRAIEEAQAREKDADARKAADRQWGDRLVLAGTYVAPGPWGKVEIGSKPGQLNLPEGMLDGDDIVPAWSPYSRSVVVWTIAPERYELDLYVGGSIDTIPPKAKPITALGLGRGDHRALSELRTCERDDVVMLKLPWDNVVVTTDPGLYTNPRRKGYVSEQDLVDAYQKRQDGRRPGEPLRGADRWGLSSRAEELLNERIAEQLDRLDTEARTALALGMASSLGSTWDVTSLVAELGEMLRQVVTSWANYPEDLEESDVVFAPGLLWALQACIDAGDPPPNLDELRTRIDVLTKGEISAEGGAE